MLRSRFLILGVVVVAATVVAVFTLFAQPLSSLKWLEQVKLVAGNSESDNDFGRAVAIDGSTAVVGAPEYSAPYSYKGEGAVYIYTDFGNTWSLQAQLLVPKEQTDHFFGSSIAIDGNTVLITARPFTRGKPPSTSIYAFTRTGSTWSLQSQFALPSQKSLPIYNSMAIDRDTAVVGGEGKAYVFQRNPATGTWSYEAELKASKDDYRFGKAVAIDGNTIIVGGDEYSTTAYVFVRDSNTGSWWLQSQLTSKAKDVGFGAAVAISGNTVVVGAPRENWEQGAAYLFERHPTTSKWSQQAKLMPSDVPMFLALGFGAGVAIDDNTVVIGTALNPLRVLRLSWDKKGAYVFHRDAATERWLQQSKLLPKKYEQVEDFYGEKVDISSDRVIVSARDRERGTAYIFKKVELSGLGQTGSSSER